MTPQEAADIINRSETHRCLKCPVFEGKWWVYRPEDDYDKMDELTGDELIAFAGKMEEQK